MPNKGSLKVVNESYLYVYISEWTSLTKMYLNINVAYVDFLYLSFIMGLKDQWMFFFQVCIIIFNKHRKSTFIIVCGSASQNG